MREFRHERERRVRHTNQERATANLDKRLREEFRDLIDWTLLGQASHAFRGKESALERFRKRVDNSTDGSVRARWNLEDKSPMS